MLTHFASFEISPPRKSLDRSRSVNRMPGSDESQRAMRAEAVRQSVASLALEGFTLDAQVVEWNQQYVDGKLTLDEKLTLIKKLYAHG